jgi:hypothetical protein
MIKLFRKIRQKMLTENKFSKYLIYAIGEIVLVVIGILIALSLNNWNEREKNEQKETDHLTNFLQELKVDKLKLNTLQENFETALLSRDIFVSIFDGNGDTTDSLGIHYRNMVSFVNDFVPTTTTIDELNNSGSLNLISNKELRRNIVILLNQYVDLRLKLELGSQKSQKLFDFVSQHMVNVSKPAEEEMLALIELSYFSNQIRFNYLSTQLNATKIAYTGCLETIGMVEKELSK